jgi:outer membrane receptor protein involved in Fe transport
MGRSKIAGTYPTITYGFGHAQNGAGPSGSNIGVQCALGYVPGLSTLCIMDSTVTYQALNDSRYNPLGTGQNRSLSGTVSGGVQNLQYSLTGSGSTDQGPVRLPTASVKQYVEYAKRPIPSWMKRPDHYTTWSGSGLVAATLSPTMRVTITSRSSMSDQQRSSIGTAGVGQLIGTFVDTTALGESSLLTGFAEKITANTKSSNSSGQLDWDVFSWMHANIVGGIDQQRGRDIAYLPAGLPTQAGSVDSTGSYSLGQREGDVISATLGTVSTIALPFHRQLRLATGFNAQKTSITGSSLSTHGIPVGVTTPTSFLNTNTTVTEQSSVNATYGWYMEPQIDLFPRLFFSPGIRIDGGSSTGIRAGATGFPKMSLAWVALDNDGVNDHPWRRWIDQLRLRGSYGYAGVQPDPSSRLRLVSQSNVVLNGGTTLLPGASIASIGNTTLRPERSVEFETGFDADLLGDRLELTATYYHKKRIDAIMASSVAASAGGGTGTGVFSSVNMSTYSQNVGEIRNEGIELTLNARLLQSDKLNWDVNASASSNTNTLVSFSDAYNASPGGRASRLVLGYPIDGLWVNSIAGYADLNGNGIIEPSEVFLTDSTSYIGTQNPPQIGSLGTNLSMLNGRLSFNAMFTYQHGGTQYNTLAVALLRSAALQPDATLERQAIYVASATFAGSGTLRPGTRYLYQSADLVRWQSASVTYILPGSIAHMLHGRSLSLSLQGNNLWLHTRYRGKDPNVNSSVYSEGVQDSGQIPMPRTFLLRVNLTS